MRIGQGYDIHVFQADRPLVLGGVRIREHDGLLGHSDADALVHAIMDALLGAAGLKDIGTYFPDTDPAYKDICSLELLARVAERIRAKGFAIGNIDATIIAQSPKLAPYIDDMIHAIAGVLEIQPEQLAIKATTKEKMDATGQGLAIECMAVCLLTEV